MSKITVSYEKKWPGPIQFSMHTAQIAVEVEAPADLADQPTALREKADKLFAEIKAIVDQKIREAGQEQAVQYSRPSLTNGVDVKPEVIERLKKQFPPDRGDGIPL